MRQTTKTFLTLSVLLTPLLLISQNIETRLLFQDVINLPSHEVLHDFNPTYQLLDNKSPYGVGARNNEVIYVLDSIVSGSETDRYFYDDSNRLFKHEILVPWGVIVAEESIIYREDNGLIDSIKVEIFNLYDGSVTSNTLRVFGYNNETQVDTVYFERNDFPNSFFKGLIIYDYESTGKVSTRTGISIDEYDNEDITSMNEFSYDTLGRLSEEKFYNIPSTFGEFGLTSVNTFSYDSLSNVVFETRDPTNPVNTTSFFEHTFNNAGDLISTLGATALTTFVYDFESTVPNLVVPPRTSPFPNFMDFYERPSRLLQREIRLVDADGNIGSTASVATYYWSERETTSVGNNILVQDIDVYPNPVNDILKFQMENQEAGLSLEIYNLMGQKQFVTSGILVDGQGIDVSLLSSGMYFFTLHDDNQVLYSSKFIKE